MRVEDFKGNELTSMDDWQSLHEPDKWKPGRSAYSVADFIVNQSGAEKLRERLSSVLGEPVAFLKLVPEYEVRFDRYGKGRFHDLGIRGNTASGGSLSSESRPRSMRHSASMSAMSGARRTNYWNAGRTRTSHSGYKSYARGSVVHPESRKTLPKSGTNFSMAWREPLTPEQTHRSCT